MLAIANKGYQKALLEDSHLLKGLNVHQGEVTHQAVAQALRYHFRDALSLLS